MPDDVVRIVWGFSVSGVSRPGTRPKRASTAQVVGWNYWGWKLSKKFPWFRGAVAVLIKWHGMAWHVMRSQQRDSAGKD